MGSKYELQRFGMTMSTVYLFPGIVRVGGRSKSPKLEQYSLKTLKMIPQSTVGNARRITRHEIRSQKCSYERSSLTLKASRSSVISLEVFQEEACIQRKHYAQFLKMASRRSINGVLLKWLNVKVRDGSKNNQSDYQRDDIPVEVATPGYFFDTEEEFDRDAGCSLRKLVVLTINEEKNPDYLKRNLVNNQPMTEKEESAVRDVNDLHRRDRWRLYSLWRQRLQKRLQEQLQKSQVEFEEAVSRDKELDKIDEYNVLRRARVIGVIPRAPPSTAIFSSGSAPKSFWWKKLLRYLRLILLHH